MNDKTIQKNISSLIQGGEREWKKKNAPYWFKTKIV